MAVVTSNLNKASGIPITAALGNLRTTYNGQNAWLDPGANKYVIDTISTIQCDIKGLGLDDQQMVDYISTATLIHCFNGWTYLSNAINALIEGDFSSAIHNAYYAELRGIISILSSQGIGVFNSWNVLIDNAGTAQQVLPKNQATHTFAKRAFDEWLKNPTNANQLLKLITIDGTPLSDWINHTELSSQIAGELASDKLKQWSLDLATISNESKFRNFVSYNPMRFNLTASTASDNIKDRMQFIIEIWKLCAPNRLFDLSLLRNSYENLFATVGTTIATIPDTDWDKYFTNLGRNVNDQQSKMIIKFLKRTTNTSDNLVFKYANTIHANDPILESDVEPFGIISRACIMLLLNSKIIESQLRQSGTSKADLKFWSDHIGIKSGTWTSTAEPLEFADLWQDVEIEIEDIQSWLDNAGNTFDAFHCKTQLKNSTFHIRNFAKAYLWNVGI